MIAQQGLQKYEDLWYEDGTIVLQVGNTLFRVYRGVLAEHSSTFRDMFAIPQPDEIDSYEECPLVALHDHASEMIHFLLAIFKPGYFEQASTTSRPFIISVLRLATKYNAAVLRSRIISLLTSYYPSTLEAWENRASSPVAHLFTDGDFMAAYMALTCNITTILPASLYCCCMRYPTSSLLNGFKAAPPSGKIKAACRSTLNSRDFFKKANRCREMSCRNALYRWRVTEEGDWDDHFYDILKGDEMDSVACTTCNEGAEELFTELREDVWDNLPSYFGLPDWEDLRKTLSEE
ncbi:hypothetical protein GLOTRDRAFT_97076 [Gloeophyllum trabeum ATCC 11539]|uniref:BTB domain-containing protein n=1 Tax=Gloeophyllum trabeum (strain ATCC 11539 / FP-39264 / Madison 617) TaxID=670483 RepID=S7R7J2_GLOTA|nr:uncharacterized protein GLOTRDRAFT_97076 [Gloeophyllum trabeum ATCC 11539]EPQ50350.1 hypothetical protein GLOTRDRAFT_97076 [Gloeophyllum trabeum ATCC 11539]